MRSHTSNQSPEEFARKESEAVVAKFLRMADYRGFIEIRPSEVEALAHDLGYRSNRWPHGGATHWLAASLATAGKHPAMRYRYRNGFMDPAQTALECIARSLNALLPANAPAVHEKG